MSRHQEQRPRAGIRHNRLQFGLLVLLNAFVGGMVGLERTVLPLIAEVDFGLASKTAIVAFIATFGVAKALLNFVAGDLGDRWTRKRVLVLGWALALPVPLILLFAPNWWWVLGANVLLGVNQGLAWSMTVVMKVDLADPDERGLATGLNEFAGYGGLALVALLTGLIANSYGLRPEPFYLGLALAVVGLVLALLVDDTTAHATRAREDEEAAQGAGEDVSLSEVFQRASLTDPTLSASSLGGLATNLKDGMLWGLLPLILAAEGLGVDRTGVVVAAYPAVWGVSQLFFGPLSDRWGRKTLIVPGMAAQALGVAGFLWATDYLGFLAAAVLTGLGTGMVYPTFLALVSDAARASWRSSALGIYRFWRDLGYAVGALGAAAIADLVSLDVAIATVAGFVALVAIAIGIRARDPETPSEPNLSDASLDLTADPYDSQTTEE